MKLIKASTFFLLLFLFSNVQAQRISGIGEKIVMNHSVQAFDKLELSGVFNVTLKQGNINKVSIEAQKNIQELIVIEEKKGTLGIHFKKKTNLKRHKRINVEIIFTDLQEIESSMVGNLSSDGTLRLESLVFDNSAVGTTHLDINVTKFEADLSAVGNIYITGHADKADIESSIVGNLDASDFIVEYLDIDNSSVGSVRVHADKELSIDHSGIGSLHYYGDAQITALSSSGIGKVKQH